MDDRTVRMGVHRLPVAWLVDTSRSRRVRTFSLGVVNDIGRHGWGNQVVLDDPHVSGKHAKIRLESGRYVLYDLAALNGTWLNGQRISRSMLMDGDVITLGTTALRFVEVRE